MASPRFDELMQLRIVNHGFLPESAARLPDAAR
jgi:hypothetical protein